MSNGGGSGGGGGGGGGLPPPAGTQGQSTSGPQSCPTCPELTMHVDADRDGRVDNDTSGLASWTRQRGAIILCNNDVDQGSDLDNANATVDGADDVMDLAPLVIRRTPTSLQFPGGYTAFLSVDRPEIRIFNRRAAGASEIIGPTRGRRYEIPDLSPQETTYGMEATAYSMNRGWNGVVTLTLEVRNGRRRVSSQRVAVRVAPWLMPNHLNPTEAVYVTNVGSDNARFRQMITTAATAAGVSTVNDPTYNDLWMQDIMELGYSTMPRVEAPGPASPQQAARWHLPVVLRTANDRSIEWNSTMDTYPRTRMVGQNFGYVEPQRPMDASSLDSFGNLECSPPVTVGRRRYRFGRIIYGTDGRRQMQHRVRTFLHAQRVQSPITFDTSWLAVGHVDEVMSFCPVPGYSPNRFKLLLASPLDALNICRRLARGSDANAPMFDGLAAAHSRFQSGTYDKATPAQVVGDHSFVSVQQVIQRRMNSIEGVLRRRLGLRSSDDVIKLPILFRRAGGGRYVAYTGGCVNMLVITRASGSAELCIPKPYGPVTGSPAAASGGTVGRPCEFERVIRDLLRHTGNGIHFIDDRGQEFITYHQGMGEVHCGTNSKRKPPVNGWWWEQEGI